MGLLVLRMAVCLPSPPPVQPLLLGCWDVLAWSSACLPRKDLGCVSELPVLGQQPSKTRFRSPKPWLILPCLEANRGCCQTSLEVRGLWGEG